MEKTNPHQTHHYSTDQLAVTIFEMEIGRLKREQRNEETIGLVESYLKERVNEIKERWKI